MNILDLQYLSRASFSFWSSPMWKEEVASDTDRLDGTLSSREGMCFGISLSISSLTCVAFEECFSSITAIPNSSRTSFLGLFAVGEEVEEETGEACGVEGGVPTAGVCFFSSSVVGAGCGFG